MGLGEDDVVEVDGGVAAWEGVGVALGEEEEVVDETLHTDGFREDGLSGLGPLLRVGVGEVDLDLGAHAGERRAELMGGVGNEALLAVVGALEAVEHFVHGGGEPANFVVAGRDGHAAIQLALGDALDLTADRLDG